MHATAWHTTHAAATALHNTCRRPFLLQVCVYDDSPSTSDGSISAGAATLARLLQYLETPPYLRQALFPGSIAFPELRAAEGMCPNLHTPHHQMREWRQWREGVVMRSEPGM